MSSHVHSWFSKLILKYLLCLSPLAPGFTPLILSATAGHVEVVEILLDQRAEIEAQSERTKDTPLSLACSGGRYEVSHSQHGDSLYKTKLCTI